MDVWKIIKNALLVATAQRFDHGVDSELKLPLRSRVVHAEQLAACFKHPVHAGKIFRAKGKIRAGRRIPFHIRPLCRWHALQGFVRPCGDIGRKSLARGAQREKVKPLARAGKQVCGSLKNGLCDFAG